MLVQIIIKTTVAEIPIWMCNSQTEEINVYKYWFSQATKTHEETVWTVKNRVSHGKIISYLSFAFLSRH